jgi:curved DNA-binding protein
MRGGGFGSRGSQDFSGELSERGRDSEADLMVTLEEAARGAIRPITLQRTTACPKCGGTGETGGKVCPVCEGNGQQITRETYKVKIPPGVREGQRLRLAGRGEAGVGEAPSGDLFLRVRLARHPDFRVEDGDLYYDLNLTPWEAVLGTKVSVPCDFFSTVFIYDDCPISSQSCNVAIPSFS